MNIKLALGIIRRRLGVKGAFILAGDWTTRNADPNIDMIVIWPWTVMRVQRSVIEFTD